MWFIKKKRAYYESLLNELETLLIKNGVSPFYLFKEPKILDYLSLYPFNKIYCWLTAKDIRQYMNQQELDFALFITKLGIIRRKPVNLLLDSPADYDVAYPYSIGWKENPKYEEEVTNYREKLEDFEKQKQILAEKRNKLQEDPEAQVYLYVKQEYAKAKCRACFGTGIVPAINKYSGIDCPKCRGTGFNEYLPKVSPAQRDTANRFKARLESLKDPEFSSFPRRKKSVFIKVVYGGQIFIFDADGSRCLLT